MREALEVGGPRDNWHVPVRSIFFFSVVFFFGGVIGVVVVAAAVVVVVSLCVRLSWLSSDPASKFQRSFESFVSLLLCAVTGHVEGSQQ